MSKGEEISRMVAERLAREDLPAPPAAAVDVGAVPAARNGCSDTCASYDDSQDIALQPKSCEGADCISYDFPVGFAGKGARRR